MASNTIDTRVAGSTISAAMFNDLKSALGTEFVGRNSAGVPTAGQDLGSGAVPWGTLRCQNAIINGDALDVSQVTAPPNRVVSGKTRTSSNQPAFITPNGAALSLIIDATPTALTLDVNGTDVTVSSDITISGLTAAPGSQNTALVNDTDAADQHDTRLWGEPEHRKSITIDTVGTNISALVGKYAAFQMDNGSDTEYFLAYVNSATELTQVKRGYFYDSSLNPKHRIVFSNNDTITLLKMGWVFVENNGTTSDVTYNNPVWSFTSPGAPVTDDYWYDLANNVWKRYDGAAFQIINRVLVGIFANSTTACVGARCIDFFAKYEDLNTLALSKFSTEIVKGSKPFQKVRVAGRTFDFQNSLASWNITTDLAAAADMYSATEQASRVYYLYVTDVGDTVISDISPYFRGDLFGEYHPHNPWRCVGLAYNDASSDIQAANGVMPDLGGTLKLDTANGYGSTGTINRRWTNSSNGMTDIVYVDDATNGSSFVCAWPGAYAMHYYDNFNLASGLYLSKNGSTTVITSAALLSAGFTSAANRIDSISATADLKIGDVILTHATTNPSGASPDEAGASFKRVT